MLLAVLRWCCRSVVADSSRAQLVFVFYIGVELVVSVSDDADVDDSRSDGVLLARERENCSTTAVAAAVVVVVAADFMCC